MSKDSISNAQLDARTEWAKFEITGDLKFAENALGIAKEAGFGANEKTVFMKNVPELSKAFDEGRMDSNTDWAITRKMEGSPHNYLDRLKPEVGKTYVGRIVDAEDGKIYQKSNVNGKDVLIEHKLSELSSHQKNAFSANADPVKIRYVGSGLGIGSIENNKQISNLEKQHAPKGMGGIGR